MGGQERSRTHYEIKKALEREAIQLFVRLYNRQHSRQYRLLYLQERPDAVLEDRAGAKLGMEITHLYCSEEEARELMGHAGSEKSVLAACTFDVLLRALNERVRRKQEKRKAYQDGYPISLLIRSMQPLFRTEHFLEAKDKLYAPDAEGGFETIWLLTRGQDGEWQLLALNQLV